MCIRDSCYAEEHDLQSRCGGKGERKMKAVVTRVTEASVTIDGQVTGEIGQGFLVLLGIGPEDTEAEAVRLADKVCGVRVFEDDAGKMLSLIHI